MSDSVGRFYWCIRHNRVESDANLCPAKHRIGPFASEEDASHALEKVQERNESWEAEDKRWTGER